MKNHQNKMCWWHAHFISSKVSLYSSEWLLRINWDKSGTETQMDGRRGNYMLPFFFFPESICVHYIKSNQTCDSCPLKIDIYIKTGILKLSLINKVFERKQLTLVNKSKWKPDRHMDENWPICVFPPTRQNNATYTKGRQYNVTYKRQAIQCYIQKAGNTMLHTIYD